MRSFLDHLTLRAKPSAGSAPLYRYYTTSPACVKAGRFVCP
nr:MAG TPA: hypothetical protein [Caudoviricetes sp.]